MVFPIGDLPFQVLATEPLLLPSREVGILDRQFGQFHGLIGAKAVVKLTHLTNENGVRPSVRDDMVHRQKEDILLLAKLDQLRPKKRAFREIEGSSRFFNLQLASFDGSVFGGNQA